MVKVTWVLSRETATLKSNLYPIMDDCGSSSDITPQTPRALTMVSITDA